MPRWIVAVMVLQSIALLIGFASQGGLATADAAQGRRMMEQEEQRQQVLPNAADQRQEQIRLLRVIAEELANVNSKLEKLNRDAEAARAPQNPPPGQ